jgi:hypothetical protein
MPTPESSLESLAIRVAKLEAQNRRLKKAGIAALFIAMAVLTMGQAKPDRTIDVDSITAAKISARVIELREGSNTVKILLPGSIIVSEKDKANVNISTSDGPSLVLNDMDGFETALGVTSLVTTKTGESHKTSAASVVLLGKDHKVLLAPLSELARSTSTTAP